MKILNRLLQEIKNLIYELRARLSSVSDKVDYDVPYVCQFAIPEHAELSLKKKLAAVDDPHWKETGASSQERYAQWAFTMCGMASAAMAIKHLKDNQSEMKIVDLAEDALQSGVYVEEGKDISNMKYREFADWIQKYDLKAEVYSRLSIKGIQYALSSGKLVIISVNPNIRGYDTAPSDQKGGHLVLATGYDMNKNTIAINNPSGFVSTNTQVKHSLPLREFGRFYAGRGIVVS